MQVDDIDDDFRQSRHFVIYYLWYIFIDRSFSSGIFLDVAFKNLHKKHKIN